ARSMGASRVVTGGQTMNPSVEQILQAIEAVAADRVIVLPNNKNAILSAEQAAQLSNKQVAVVKTRSIPQGFAALLSFNSEEGPDQNAEVMQAAAATVRTIEITRAARAARTGALLFEAGTPIGLIDDQPAVTSSTTADALLAATERLMPADGAALALYYGQEVNADEANAVSKRLQERFPSVDVETISGGQPYYDYILSVE
ncbi:MAG TPA: DAK2 domain-containing protein, partial [Dehalococcoidia bacterium]